MAIDLKKNRLRIHRATLRLLEFPPFIKLLFSPKHNAIAVVKCDKQTLRGEEIRVTYDYLDDRRTFDIYSKDLMLMICHVFDGLDETGLYRLKGFPVPEEGGVYFNLNTLTRVEDKHVQVIAE